MRERVTRNYIDSSTQFTIFPHHPMTLMMREIFLSTILSLWAVHIADCSFLSLADPFCCYHMLSTTHKLDTRLATQLFIIILALAYKYLRHSRKLHIKLKSKNIYIIDYTTAFIKYLPPSGGEGHAYEVQGSVHPASHC